MKTLLGFSVKIEHISSMIIIACFFLISGIALIIYEMNFYKVILKKLIKNFVLNRYRTVWRFKGHANSRARISVEK